MKIVIHPWKCPNCGDDGAPYLLDRLGIYECVECGYTVAVDEVGP